MEIPCVLLLGVLVSSLAAQQVPHAGYLVINGHAIVEGDIDAGPVESPEDARLRPLSFYTSPQQAQWPNATIPYVIDADIPQPERITGGMALWTSATPIKFVARTNEPNFVHFVRQPSGVCISSQGMIGGEQFIRVLDSCTLFGMTHEMGHAIGLLHEQSRPDRDYYVTVHLENMDKRYAGSSLLITDGSTHAGYFDYGSIMEYSAFFYASTTQALAIETIPPGIVIDGTAHGPSAADIDRVNRLYGAVPDRVTITSDPEGLQIVVDGVAVTTPRSFNWTLGSVHTLDVPEGQGDGTPIRYLFGRWGDNRPRAHSITVSPDTTVYSAAFIRQYQVKTGVSPSDGGTVAISPASEGYYTENAPVTVTATALNGYTFSGWNGTGSFTFLNLHGWAETTASFLVTIPNLAYVAHFTKSPLMTFTTDPPDLPLTVGNSRGSGPRTVAVNRGGTVQVSADPTISFSTGATRYVFQGWSDGGAAAHTVTAPAAGDYPVITAKYKVQYTVTATFTGRGSVTVAPSPPDGYYDEGSTVQITASPASGYQLAGWSGDLSGTAASQTVTVNDQVLATASFQQPFTLAGVVNAASFVSGAVSPGEIVTIFGLLIGPPALTRLELDSSGNVATLLGGTRVLFDGIAAPVVYTSAGQIAAIAPYALSGKTATSIQVELNGRRTPAATFAVSATAPGIFTVYGSGRGLGAILNQDNSPNSATNPAPRGSVVVLYVTGEGQTTPVGVDGKLAGSSPLPKPLGAVTVHIGGPSGVGTQAEVLYAGAAPGLVAGVMQINVVIPADAPSGSVPLYFSAGNANSVDMTSVAIRD